LAAKSYLQQTQSPNLDCHVWTALSRQGGFWRFGGQSGAVMYTAFECGPV
jgi:hypothetical protein